MRYIIQGGQAASYKPPLDVDLEVAFYYKVLTHFTSMSTGGMEQAAWSPCNIVHSLSFADPAEPGRPAPDHVRAGDDVHLRLLPRHEPRPLHPHQRGGRTARGQHLPTIPVPRPRHHDHILWCREIQFHGIDVNFHGILGHRE